MFNDDPSTEFLIV